MSSEINTESGYGDGPLGEPSPATILNMDLSIINKTSTEEFSTGSGSLNDTEHQFDADYGKYSSVFEAFIITEIVMTAMELILSISAALKIPRWRNNYRNQMLMQLSLVRFIKRIIALLVFYRDEQSAPYYEGALLFTCQVYVDLVVVILVCFFIKHMYESLLLVLVKISQNSFCRVLICSWLVPIPASALWTITVIAEWLEPRVAKIIICVLIRWPLMVIGTIIYIIILYTVLKDRKRQFTRTLTILTFAMCVVINLYLFFKDVIDLWCIHTVLTNILSYSLGFVMNLLILCMYIIFIALSLRHQKQCKLSTLYYNYNKGTTDVLNDSQ